MTRTREAQLGQRTARASGKPGKANGGESPSGDAQAAYSERAIIGCILEDHRRWAVVSQLQGSDFQLLAHQIVFDLCRELKEQGKAFEELLICSELEKRNQLQLIGGYDYLLEVEYRNGHVPECLPDHVRRVREASNLRKQRRVYAKAQEMAELPRADPTAIQQYVASELEKLPAASAIDIDNLPSVRSYDKKWEFLVPGLLVKNTVAVWSGPSEAGKSSLALWLCDAIAHGKEMFDGKCEQHPALYLTLENPVEHFDDICQRLAIADGPDSNLHILGDWSEPSPPLPNAAPILAWVTQHKPFVVVDSLIAFFDGDNENDAVQMRAFIQNHGRKLLRAGACGVLFLTHPGKAESAQEYRGSSDLRPAIDTGYKLHNSGEHRLERLTLKAFKVRCIQQPNELLLHYTQKDGRDTFVSDDRPRAIAESVTAQLKKLLAENPAIKSREFEKAAQAKGLGQTRARNFLKDGVADGTIRQDDGPHRAKLHTLIPVADSGPSD